MEQYRYYWNKLLPEVISFEVISAFMPPVLSRK